MNLNHNDGGRPNVTAPLQELWPGWQLSAK